MKRTVSVPIPLPLLMVDRIIIILKKLFSLGIRNLLVEGGDKITKNMLKNKFKKYSFYSIQGQMVNIHLA